jgi:hypothetical protein
VKEILILFLGRSIDGIVNDARREFPGEKVQVVRRDDDKLEAPAGLDVVAVSDFQPQAEVKYVVVANGGTSSQLVPALKALVEAGVSFEVYDLQRDGAKRLW